MLKLLLLTNVAVTLFMVGVIWLIQIVHYPLFAKVGTLHFQEYENQHTTLITWVVGPAMLVELITSFMLVVVPVRNISPIWPLVGLGLVGMIWAVTVFLSVPQHAILATGFDTNSHRQLVTTNWIRTIAWTLRGILMLAIVWKVIDF